MKYILKSTLYFAFFLSLLPFFGCGSDDEPEVIPLNGTGSGEFRTESGEFRFPPGTSEYLWKLTDADIAELLNLDIPLRYWERTDIDGETRKKYYHAELLKQFGDIPEVRYLIAYDRHPKEKTLEQIIAKVEARYRLWPNEENRIALEQIKSVPPTLIEPAETEREWAQRNPDAYYKYLLGGLIEYFGDIPEVYTVARFQVKIFQGKKLTDTERQEYDHANEHLQELHQQREKKQGEKPDD
jgi:hypothetical protein